MIDLIQIKTPYFTAGIEIFGQDTIVGFHTEIQHNNICAPILEYMRFWAPSRIREYCKKKGWGYFPIIK